MKLNYEDDEETTARMLGIALSELEKIHRSVNDHAPNSSSSVYTGIGVIKANIDKRRYDEALLWANVLEPRFGHTSEYLNAMKALWTKRGEISEVLALTHEIARKHKRIDPVAIRRLEGRFKELTGWYPKIPGSKRPVVDPVPGRILHLVKESRPFLSNGFTSRSHNNFLAEAKAGLEPIVVTEPGFPRGIVGGQFAKHHNVDGILHTRLDLGDIDYAGMPVDAFLQIFAELAYEEVVKLRPSIIHASSGRRGYETALVGLSLKEKTGLPFVYEVRSFFEGNWTPDMEWEETGEVFDRRMRVEKMCMDAADRVLTIGDAMRDEIISRGVDPAKVGIIPNAVDSARFVPQSRSTRLADLLGLGDFPTFGYVSNMDHYRESQETLIEACALLKQQGSEARCVLVGDGPRRPKLKQLAVELGIEERVIFTGAVDHMQIPEYYSIIDLFVVPRVAERAAKYVTPLKPFEAMALGKPVIVSDLPALKEIVEEPIRGLTFQNGNAASLSDILAILFVDKERAGKMAMAGMDWVTKHRTWAGNGERYQQEFSQIEGRIRPL